MPQTPEQESIINRALRAAETLESMARDADRFNLPILSREFDYYAQELRLKINLQRMALNSPLFDD